MKKESRFICPAQTNAMLDKPTVFDPDFKPEYWWEKEEYDEYD